MKKNLADLIGSNFRQARKELGLTLDEVASEASDFGLKWNTARVSNLENGRATPNIQTLLIMAYVLSSASEDYRISPMTLLQAHEGDVIEIGKTDIYARSYNMLLEGALDELMASDVEGGKEAQDKLLNNLQASLQEVSEFNSKLPDAKKFTLRDWIKAGEKYSLADERAARKIGLSKDQFIVACFQKWGHPLSVETESRSKSGDSPQKRGRITRELLAELKDYLPESITNGDD